MNPRRARRYLFIVLGCVCTGLGILGIFLPLVPTTPLLLLAAFFFARSSRRFYDWLLGNRWTGPVIRNFRDQRPMPVRELVITLAVLWVTAVLTVTLVIPVWPGRAAMLGIAGGVTIYLVGRNVKLRRARMRRADS